jgi:hypothetical protein
MDELLRDFLTETVENFDQVDAQLVRLERPPKCSEIPRFFKLVEKCSPFCLQTAQQVAADFVAPSGLPDDRQRSQYCAPLSIEFDGITVYPCQSGKTREWRGGRRGVQENFGDASEPQQF